MQVSSCVYLMRVHQLQACTYTQLTTCKWRLCCSYVALVLFSKEQVYRIGKQLFSYIYAVERSSLHLNSYILHRYTCTATKPLQPRAPTTTTSWAPVMCSNYSLGSNHPKFYLLNSHIIGFSEQPLTAQMFPLHAAVP